MSEKKNTTSYIVARRGELLAEQFLLELEPKQVSSLQNQDIGFDYIVFFTKADGSTSTVAVEVKSTEKEIIGGRYSLPTSSIEKLLNSNLPVLIIVVNVKSNEIYFNWIRDSIPTDYKKTLEQRWMYTVKLRKATPTEVEKLKKEILQLSHTGQ